MFYYPLKHSNKLLVVVGCVAQGRPRKPDQLPARADRVIGWISDILRQKHLGVALLCGRRDIDLNGIKALSEIANGQTFCLGFDFSVVHLS